MYYLKIPKSSNVSKVFAKVYKWYIRCSGMQTFTIRDIENMTGIKAHTLRIWEQRYGLFNPKRRESAHRIYDNDDLKQILRVSFLYHSGWKISRIAVLSPAQVTERVRAAVAGQHNYALYATRMMEAAVDFHEEAFREIFREVVDAVGFEKAVVDVCYPYLLKVGHLWSTNNVIPAQEHFSSYIIQNRIILETDRLPATPGKPEVILFCPQGEFHELPLLFINYLLRKYGWRTLYLGCNISLKNLEPVAAVTDANFLFVHLLTNFTGYETDDYFEAVCRAYGQKTIIASGASVLRMQRSFSNLQRLTSYEEIHAFITQHRTT